MPVTYQKRHRESFLIKISNTGNIQQYPATVWIESWGMQYCGSRRFIPDPVFFIPDPGSGSASKNLSILTPKNCFYGIGNMIQKVHTESGSWFFTHPGSRGQKGTGSRIRTGWMEETYLLPEVTKLNPCVSMVISEEFTSTVLLNGGASPSARGDKAEALGLNGDTGALDVLLHVPVDKRRFPRRMVPWRGQLLWHYR